MKIKDRNQSKENNNVKFKEFYNCNNEIKNIILSFRFENIKSEKQIKI